ncbi:MAG: AfsA-related hotdog domain-containing protein [Pseudoruegeria sp.]
MSAVLIDPAIVHKNSPDDVLLCDPHYAFSLNSPLHQEEEREFCSDISDKQRAQIELPKAVQDSDPYFEEWRTCRGVPYQISAERPNESTNAGIRDAWDRHPNIARASSFGMLNNADNYYFYRKPHEHVPGTMFIEAARQACYFHSYTVLDIPKKQVTLTLDELNSRFFSYAELMYPVEIVVDEIKSYDSNKPNRIFLRASFYQREKLFAIVDSKINVIDLDVFKKIRNVFLFSSDWYRPIAAGRVTAVISDTSDNTYAVDLTGISKTGCITSAANLDPASIQKVRIEGSNSLELNATLVSAGADTLKLRFDNMTGESTLALGEIIKRNFVYLGQTPETQIVDASC